MNPFSHFKTLLGLLLVTSSLYAQNGGTLINANGLLPTTNSPAVLEVASTTKGLLIPRMTSTQRNGIASPALGLLVYQTNSPVGLWSYNGSSWEQIGAGSGSGSSWGLVGNTGTNPVSNFIGTTDNQALRFRVNNIQSGEIHPSNGNTGLGYNILAANTTGVSNTATGSDALKSNTIGSYNTANGHFALSLNTAGSINTALGTSALYNNTTGNYNTATGVNTLGANTEGSNNTADGYAALRFNTTGVFNTATGHEALYNNTTGDGNTAIGGKALYDNTTGEYNVANGYDALRFNTTGFYNTANGHAALRLNTTGGANTATGHEALYNNTTGFFNTAFGDKAGINNITGIENTFLGYQAQGQQANLNNATAIGAFALVNASNKVRIGGANVTVIEGQVAWSFPSDRRLKENITVNNRLGLNFITQLQPVSYNYISDKTKVRHEGFIAQDVEKVMKDLNLPFSGLKKSDDGMYSLAYSDFVMPLVNAVKEQQSQIEALKKENEALKKGNEVLEALVKRVAALEEKSTQNSLRASAKK